MSTEAQQSVFVAVQVEALRSGIRVIPVLHDAHVVQLLRRLVSAFGNSLNQNAGSQANQEVTRGKGVSVQPNE